MPTEQNLFIGLLVDDVVVACMENCEERDRQFIEDPMYLETVEIEGVRYIGKRIASDTSQDRVDDTARSVVSLLNRIDRVAEHKASSVRIIAFEETAGAEVFS